MNKDVYNPSHAAIPTDNQNWIWSSPCLQMSRMSKHSMPKLDMNFQKLFTEETPLSKWLTRYIESCLTYHVWRIFFHKCVNLLMVSKNERGTVENHLPIASRVTFWFLQWVLSLIYDAPFSPMCCMQNNALLVLNDDIINKKLILFGLDIIINLILCKDFPKFNCQFFNGYDFTLGLMIIIVLWEISHWSRSFATWIVINHKIKCIVPAQCQPTLIQPALTFCHWDP